MILDQFGQPARPVRQFPVPEWVQREVMAQMRRESELLMAMGAAPAGSPEHNARFPFRYRSMPLDERCKGWTKREDA